SVWKGTSRLWKYVSVLESNVSACPSSSLLKVRRRRAASHATLVTVEPIAATTDCDGASTVTAETLARAPRPFTRAYAHARCPFSPRWTPSFGAHVLQLARHTLTNAAGHWAASATH